MVSRSRSPSSWPPTNGASRSPSQFTSTSRVSTASATSTPASGVVAAKLAVPQSGSTSHRRWAARAYVTTDDDTARQSPEHDPRTTARGRAILDAAAGVFLRDGYAGANMDEVAAMASASKQTVYKYFSDKETLFRELVATTVRTASGPVRDEVIDLRDSGDVAADLRDLAFRQLSTVMQPRMMSLRRLIIGEATRFPELARTFYELGPQRTITTLATTFEHLARRGLLQADDPITAAEHFYWLVMSTPLNRAMFLADDHPPLSELERRAEEGVRVFLAAYGAPSITP